MRTIHSRHLKQSLSPCCLRSGRLLVSLIAILIVSAAAIAQENRVMDEIVAVVEDDIILRSDVNAIVMSAIQQQGLEYSDELWEEGLMELVDQKVILAYAREDTNVVVTDDQVEQELDSRLSAIAAQAGSEQRLEELYGKSMVEIRAEMRDRVRDQLLAGEYQRMQFQGLKVTPSEVREWFSQFPQDSLPEMPQTVRVSHIVRFPEIDPAARAEARSICSVLRDSVANGASLEELARLFSDDPGSAQDGGRYESIRLSELVPEFGAVASTLEPGELSQVFETAFGFHFVRLNSRVGDIVDVNHILIRINESRILPGAAIDYLNAVRDSILQYDIPFEVMAKRHSEDEQSVSRGGQVVEPRSGERELPTEALGPLWVRTLSTLEEGEISEPAETQLLDGRTAYHIVRLERRREAHRVSIETDYARIEQFALQAKQARLRAEWIEQLSEDVFISIRASEIDPSTG